MYNTTTSSDAEIGAMFGLLLVGYGLFILLSVIPTLLTLWRLFTKAGEPGWATLVPYYNIYVMTKVAKLEIMWLILAVFVPFVVLYVYYKMFEQFGKSIGDLLLFIFLPLVTLFLSSKWQYQGAPVQPPVFPQQIPPTR